jgi:hypothetical protein
MPGRIAWLLTIHGLWVADGLIRALWRGQQGRAFTECPADEEGDRDAFDRVEIHRRASGTGSQLSF